MSGTEAGAAAAALAHVAAEHGVSLDAAQAGELDRYTDLLLAWNARINLTGARTKAALVADHLPDAFALAARLDAPARVVDVGSGGGLPALPLAVLRPALSIDLCEPIAKKGAFLRTAIRELGLGARVRLLPERAEALLARASASYDVAISRATFPPAEWLSLGGRLVRPGGRVFALLAGDGIGEPTDRRYPYDHGRRTLLERDVPRGTSDRQPPPRPGV